ncbi:ABC transporter ATP-binding protein/permease [Capilliphycus salinus ALCB114379]|uniref:ABC transporter ATP-binding protein/permease n=1 Tax=Capilliphycus salinus TaxID=2768948 RepID=UPI0039A4DDA0
MNYQFNTQFWQQFGLIAKPYWFSREKRKARLWLLLLIFLSIISSGFLVLETLQRGEILSGLAEQNYSRFLQATLLFLGLILIGVPSLAFNNYIQSNLSLHWRRWMTRNFLERYLDHQAFYHLNSNSEIDNPDQRISEDIRAFTQQSLYFFVLIFNAVIQLIFFIGLLWSISHFLTLFLVLYALVGTLIATVVFARSLAKINYVQLQKEAELRYGLVHLQDHAEAIALYQGQSQASQGLHDRFLQVYQNFSRLIKWEFNLSLFQNSLQYITFILPAIILAPSILSGQLEIGVIAQSESAFGRIWFALSLIINELQQLSALAASTTRLFILHQALNTSDKLPTQTTIQVQESQQFKLENIILKTPDHQKILIQNLSLIIQSNQSLLITGASGVGKSSLLRAIAGLWTSGEGKITRPQREQMFFLPQRPYMILGSLRQQLLYPHSETHYNDKQLLDVLKQVNLPNISDQFGGLDSVIKWSQVLSLGEQQRLAFARLLLHKPQFAILDEATSALDEENEELLYQYLQKTTINLISVGHRSTLLKYHQQVLELSENFNWRLIDSDKYYSSGSKF